MADKGCNLFIIGYCISIHTYDPVFQGELELDLETILCLFEEHQKNLGSILQECLEYLMLGAIFQHGNDNCESADKSVKKDNTNQINAIKILACKIWQ